MEIGDIVARKSYGCDIYFRIYDELPGGEFLLRGLDYRIYATAGEEDLERIEKPEIRSFKKLFQEDFSARAGEIVKARKGRGEVPGKVLHLDSDREYLSLCAEFYRKMEVPAVLKAVTEAEQKEEVEMLIRRFTPDIVVFTGHDSLRKNKNAKNIESYTSSKYFAEAVRTARKLNPSKDSLVIIAGACQSYYEEIIFAGANLASSPERVPIHALDPVFIAERIASAGIETILTAAEALKNSITGLRGCGGLDTRGTRRACLPVFKY